MGQILDKVIQFFEQDNWQFSLLEGEQALQTAFSSDQGNWMCFAQAIEDEATTRFFFYSVCPIKAQENKQAVVEFITRANYGLSIGNFEFDFFDGEVRFKTSLDITEDGFGLAIIERLVYTNVLMMDRYLPGLMAVIAGRTIPEEAIRVIEDGSQSIEEKNSSEKRSGDILEIV